MTQAKKSTLPRRLRVTRALAKAFREARAEAGLTSTALAELLGCDPRQVRAREMGREGIGIHALWDMAAALDIPVADFVDRVEELALPGESRCGDPP